MVGGEGKARQVTGPALAHFLQMHVKQLVSNNHPVKCIPYSSCMVLHCSSLAFAQLRAVEEVLGNAELRGLHRAGSQVYKIVYGFLMLAAFPRSQCRPSCS